MKRGDKGRAVARYLTAVSGIPNLSYDLEAFSVVGPPPFTYPLVTDASNSRFMGILKRNSGPVIRYDKFIESVDDSIVGMKLDTFASLLALQYNSLQDRVTTYIEGD